MIDIESELFSEISQKVRNQFPNIFITGEYVKSPPSFPCVSLIEIDNIALKNTQSTESNENHVSVTYELNVYSNKTKGKKAECKKILMKFNFTRIMLEPIQNQDEATIYRMVGRYQAVISKQKVIFRR